MVYGGYALCFRLGVRTKDPSELKAGPQIRDPGSFTGASSGLRRFLGGIEGLYI